MGDRRRRWAPARAIFTQEMRDQVRDRRALLARLGPVVAILLGVVFAVVSAATDGDAEDRRDVAFPMDAVIDRDLGQRLADDGLALVHVPDVRAAVAEGTAPVGLLVDAHGYTVTTRDEAGTAAVTRALRAALVHHDLAVNPLPTTVPLRVHRVEASASQARELFATVLPGIVAFVLPSAFTNAAGQWTESARRGVLAHQLTLPVPRHHMLLALTAAEAGLMLVAASPVLALLALGVASAVGSTAGVLAVLTSVVLLGVAALALVTLYGLGGLHLAIRRLGAPTSGLVLVPYLLGMLLTILYGVADDVPSAIAVVPVIGVLDALHQAVDSGVPLGSVVAALACSIVGLAVLARWTAALDTSDFGMRAR